MRRTGLSLSRAVLLWTAACAPSGPPPPEEPTFFDDIGCLKSYLEQNPSLPPGAVAYVSDHRSGVWVPARSALYVRSPSVETPMGSGLLAYADAASRDADPDATGGAPLSSEDVFGPAGSPDGPER